VSPAEYPSKTIGFSNNASLYAATVLAKTSPAQRIGALKRIRQLQEFGEALKTELKGIANDRDGLVQKALFSHLIGLYFTRLKGVANEADRLISRYGDRNLSGLHLWRWQVAGSDHLAADPTVESRLASFIDQCDDNPSGIKRDFPGKIPTPRGLTSRMLPYVRVANRIDPARHQVNLCYTVLLDNFVVWKQSRADIDNRRALKALFHYAATPTVVIRLSMTDVAVPFVFAQTWDSTYWFSAPADAPAPGHDTFSFLGEWARGSFPPQYKSDESIVSRFVKFASNPPALNDFVLKAKRGIFIDGEYRMESDSMHYESPGLTTFVNREITSHQLAVLSELQAESQIGSLRKPLREAMAVRVLLRAYMELAFGKSLENDLELQEFAARYLAVSESGTEWESIINWFQGDRLDGSDSEEVTCPIRESVQSKSNYVFNVNCSNKDLPIPSISQVEMEHGLTRLLDLVTSLKAAERSEHSWKVHFFIGDQDVEVEGGANINYSSLERFQHMSFAFDSFLSRHGPIGEEIPIIERTLQVLRGSEF
jgi:hypothetical protein